MSANNNNNVDSDAKQVVRIDQDSAEDNLQAMFDLVLKPQPDRKIPLQVPFRMRKLPNSFFNPPSTGSKSPSVSHTRENSADSAFGSGTTTICPPTGINPQSTSRLQISHLRAHSSPASLQQTYAGLNTQNNNNNSNKNNSNNANASNTPGQPANNGGANAQQQSQQQQQAQPQQTIQPVHMKQRSYDVVSAIQLQEELGDLPPGWEQARTAEGQIYYLK